MLTQYSTENEQFKRMIRRFDEIISTKINCVQFDEFKKFVMDSFLSTKEFENRKIAVDNILENLENSI